MGATEEMAAHFHAMTNNSALAMLAAWGDGLDRAFEAVEGVVCARCDQFEAFVIFVAANLTDCHKSLHSHSKILCGIVARFYLDVIPSEVSADAPCRRQSRREQNDREQNKDERPNDPYVSLVHGHLPTGRE